MPHRSIQLARRNESAGKFVSVCAFGDATCSTPELSQASAGRLLLSWSERDANGRWQGKVHLLREGQTTAETTLADKADILFVQAQQGPRGQFWAVYEKAEASGCAVVLKQLPELERQ
jgi:hypothetical protein